MLDVAFLSDEVAVLIAVDRLIWVRRGEGVSETPLDETPLHTLRWRGELYEELAFAVDDDAFYRLSFLWIMERMRKLQPDGRVSVERKRSGVWIWFDGSRFGWKRVIVAGSGGEGARGLLRNILISKSGATYGVAAVYEEGEGRILSAWAPMTKKRFSVRIEAEPSLVLLSGTRLVIPDRRGLLAGDIGGGSPVCVQTIRAGDEVFRTDRIIGVGIGPDWTTACLTADGWLLYCRPGFEDTAFAAFRVSVPKSARLARISPSLSWATVVTDKGAMPVEIPRPTPNTP